MLRLSVLLVLISIVAAPCLAQSIASEGFIYGTLTLQNGDQHTGFLRWEDEEAYWDDLFHSRQDDLPWIRYADLKDLHREKEKRYFETHGMIDRIHYANRHFSLITMACRLNRPAHPDSDMIRCWNGIVISGDLNINLSGHSSRRLRQFVARVHAAQRPSV